MSSRLITGLATAVVALGALYLGVPRAASGLAGLPGDHVISLLRYDQPVSSRHIATLAESRERGLAWIEDRKAWAELGLARLLAIEAGSPDDDARKAAAKRAVEAIENGLALAPNDGYAWARLAIARYLADNPAQSVADAVAQSYLIAEFDRRLVFERLDVALAVWELLPADVRAKAQRQALYAYKIAPKRLAVLAHTPERRVRIIAGLAESPERMANFEAHLRRTGR